MKHIVLVISGQLVSSLSPGVIELAVGVGTSRVHIQGFKCSPGCLVKRNDSLVTVLGVSQSDVGATLTYIALRFAVGIIDAKYLTQAHTCVHPQYHKVGHPGLAAVIQKVDQVINFFVSEEPWA